MANAGPGQQALPVLVPLDIGELFGEVAAGLDCDHHVLALCPRNRRAVGCPGSETPYRRPEGKRHGMAYVIIDVTWIPIDRIAADRPFYSGKHTRHGMNLLVIASPDGRLL